MTDAERLTLRRLAEQAKAKGPWVDHATPDAIAAFIAACSSDVVLALLDAVEQRGGGDGYQAELEIQRREDANLRERDERGHHIVPLRKP